MACRFVNSRAGILQTYAPSPWIRTQFLRSPTTAHEASGFACGPSTICYSHDARRKLDEFRDTEKDPRYQRLDDSEEHALQSRAAFLATLSRGESGVDLAEAALHIAAEDDALVSHSSCEFPVKPFQSRLQRFANDIDRTVLPSLRERNATAEDTLAAILEFMFNASKGFSPPSFGRSALPLGAIVDNPGVYEDARLAYLHEVLVRRKGIPAALAIVLSDVLRRLLIMQAINFVARINCSNLAVAPTAEVLPGMTRSSVIREASISKDSTSPVEPEVVLALNMLSTDALAECLAHLKRAYWPFPWDGRRGGFAGAARAWLDGADSAEAAAIARTAEHRLRRGIFTSPGAGDLRRALAASERLVILRGEIVPEERRDLAVLYCHAGRLREARAELRAYADLLAKRERSTTATGLAGKDTVTDVSGDGNNPRNARQYKLILTPGAGISVATSEGGLEDAVLADRLATVLRQLPVAPVTYADEYRRLTLDVAMERCLRTPGAQQILPLTW